MSDTSTWPEGLQSALRRARTDAAVAADAACGLASARKLATAASDKVSAAERELRQWESEQAQIARHLEEAQHTLREREHEATQCAAMLARVDASFRDAITKASDDAERRLGSIAMRVGLGVDDDGNAWRVLSFTASSIVAESVNGTRAAFDLKPSERGGHVELTNGVDHPVELYLLHGRDEIATRLAHGPIQFPPAALVAK